MSLPKITTPSAPAAASAPGGSSHFTLRLTQAEIEALADCLAETAMAMDDDGRDGYFDSTPLRPVYNKVREAMRASSAGRTER